MRTPPTAGAWNALREDHRRMTTAMLGTAPVSRTRQVMFLLSNSEMHAVMCYRLGRAVQRATDSPRAVRLALTVLHRLWNRRVTHHHHCDISPRASIAPGMRLMHRCGVIIGPARIGRNVVIHQNVTIGQRVAGGDQGLPTIGDDVWIGPGAIITGAIRIGHGATVSAGTVLSRDVPARALVAGVPGRVVNSDYDNRAMLGLTG